MVQVKVAASPFKAALTAVMTGAVVSGVTKVRGALVVTGSVVVLPEESADTTR